MKIVVVIPARYASSRFEGKPLIEILGKSMIRRVYEQCIKAFSPKNVYVATDDERIISHCKTSNINVIKTSSNCLTGTDRIAEFSKIIDADYYINVQGDEPIIDPKDILKIKEAIQDHKGKVLNGYASIKSEKEFFSLSIPKVVFREDERLLYMSRAGIPLTKSNKYVKGFRQICIYAFPKKALLEFYNFNKKTQFEQVEDIEILRFLELGYDVQMVQLSNSSIAVDFPEDVEKVISYLKNTNV